MTAKDDPINFLWFIPTSGDGAYLGSNELNRSRTVGPQHFWYRHISESTTDAWCRGYWQTS